ncbi:MAG: MOSC domain-containing protein [Betaproteobacteria bacterium]|nr:MOSC domain-containing protein [Betaproteobacteria bacterium]
MTKLPTGLRELMSVFPATGRVEWIGIRPAPRAPMQVVDAVEALVDRGLQGDRTAMRARPGNDRQVTLIQAEHLQVVAALLHRDAVAPALTRRNVVVAGVNLLALKGHTFRIGEAVLEMTGDCHPCSLMETALGPGGYNAMRGHGGITARVLQSGTIRPGDALVPLIEAIDNE